MEIFAAYVAWANFIDVRRIEAEIEEANVETELKLMSASLMLTDDPKAKVTLLRAEKDLDPEVVAAQARLLQVHARVKMLTVLVGNMERGAALLSRELTRRVGRSPVEGRAASWGT
jgi:hypothetical protein